MRNKKNNLWLWATKNPLVVLLCAAIFALGFAYISQYFFDYQPCILCYHQRKPFFAIIPICLFGLFVLKSKNSQKYLTAFCALLLLINTAIAFYHSGVENKIFAGPSTCSSVSNLNQITDLNELAQALENTKAIRCDEPQFIFLKLSMAEWNVLYCLILLIFSVASLKLHGHFFSRR